MAIKMADAIPCVHSKQCPMEYRMGGCCGRFDVPEGFDKLTEQEKKNFEMQGEGGVCMFGSSVEAFEGNKGEPMDIMEYSRQIWKNDPMVQASWDKEGRFKSFDDFHGWLSKEMPQFAAQEGIKL